MIVPKTKAEVKQEIITEDMLVVNPNAAGIDIASKEHWVCVPKRRDEENIKRFSAFTCDLYAIARWLKKCSITTVAMESTSVYWIPLFQILESEGFEVYLVNAKHFKNVPGRGKTDRLDCQWLQKLHSFGLLRASFRPNDQICQIRTLLRYRESLIRMNAKHTQHMHKALDQMNIKLGKVIDDITGVSGTKIISAILDGQRDPEKLADLCDYRIKAGREEIIKSLEGDYRREHLFTLKQSLQLYRFTTEQIVSCDNEIENFLQHMDDKMEVQATFEFFDNKSLKKKKRRSNEPYYNAQRYLLKIVGVDVTKVDGLGASTVQTIVFEVGLDMHKFKTDKHFTSWLGLSPEPNKTGGKDRTQKTRKVQSRAAAAFRLGARSLQHSTCYLGNFFRRVAARRGYAKAVTATARKLAVIYYHMVKEGKEYQALDENFYEQQYKQRVIKNLEKRAKQLGFELVPQKD